MGLLKKITGGGGIGDFLKVGFTNPGQGIDKALGTNTFSYLTDPMDLWGYRAGDARDKVEELQRLALDNQNRAYLEQYANAVKQQKPYYDAGVNALSNLENAGNIPPSQQYTRDLEQGSRALNRSLAASGQFDSSNAYNRFGDFYNQLSGEEMGRRYNNALAPVKIAQNAMGAIGSAADTYGSGMSSAYGNYGNQQAQNALNYGQNRANAYNTLGQSFNSAMNYYGGR